VSALKTKRELAGELAGELLDEVFAGGPRVAVADVVEAGDE